MRLLIAGSLVLLVLGCSGGGEFDRKINHPDENYMSDLARELDAAGVSFRVPRDGSIVYRSSDDEKVKALEERVKNNAAARASAKR